jgi:hypothetical protein
VAVQTLFDAALKLVVLLVMLVVGLVLVPVRVLVAMSHVRLRPDELVVFATVVIEAVVRHDAYRRLPRSLLL